MVENLYEWSIGTKSYNRVAGVFFPYGPDRTASALSGSLIRCSAPKMEDDIVRSAQWY